MSLIGPSGPAQGSEEKQGHMTGIVNGLMASDMLIEEGSRNVNDGPR